MQHGRYENRTHKAKKPAPRRKRNKLFLLTLSLVLILGIVGGSTLAYLMTGSQEVTNTFTPGKVDCEQSGGAITNKGNVNAYIRAAVVVNWVNGSNEILGLTPAYTVTANSGWTKGSDGYFYYNSAVAPNHTTNVPYGGISIDSNVTIPDGFSQSIQVIAEAIQADGMGVSNAQGAWAVAAG